jgi:hypothetical protein
MSITMPNWTFDAIWTQVLGILQNPVISGLVLASIALSLAAYIIDFLKRVGHP